MCKKCQKKSEDFVTKNVEKLLCAEKKCVEKKYAEKKYVLFALRIRSIFSDFSFFSFP